ncbi:MAG: hypothetical protein ACXAC2_23145, partial [Candidatus Kariarchaeaceae archaeon]
MEDFDSESKLNDNLNFSSEILSSFPRKLIKNFQIPKILFIVDQFDSLDPNYDQPFYDYMTGILGFIVDLHSDDNTYDTSTYDAIVISQSIAESSAVNSISNVSVPILTMEPFNHQEFRLSDNRGNRQLETNIALVNSSPHYILDDIPSQTVTIYNQSFDLPFIKDYSLVRIDEIESLGSVDFLPHVDIARTLVALEKGKLDWFGIPAFERRVLFSGAEGLYYTSDAWNIFNKSLHWVLYDDVSGSATIDVNIFDLNDQPLENAGVNLLNLNTSQSWDLNSSISGLVSFTNIPYGIYNISIDYQGKINSSLNNLNIFGPKTYDTVTSFTYSVNIDTFIDHVPPLIQNIDFDNDTQTFSADIYDSSSISLVRLNLTVVNETTGTVIRDNTSQMVTTDGTHFFNNTALAGIIGTDISFNYNITAIDVAGNLAYSSNQSVNLADSTAPVIHNYNATNFGNGTVIFYANVTDTQSTVHEVILRINMTDYDMQFDSSGFWIFVSEFDISETLNYTIYSFIDTVGNQGGSVDSKIISLSDKQAPHIYGVTDTFTLFINNGNLTNQMDQIGSIVFTKSYQFNFNDTVSYFISAYDVAGNLAVGDLHGNFTVDDKIKPIVNYNVQDFGNGTIEFSSLTTDWPNNQTSATLFYTQDFFGSWINLPMAIVNDTYHSIRVKDLILQSGNVWYYII